MDVYGKLFRTNAEELWDVPADTRGPWMCTDAIESWITDYMA
jgi:hypothetical protein